MLEAKPNDLLPGWANQTLILCWLLLLGGRWAVITPLIWAGSLSAEQTAALDDVLLKVYLILFALTCVAQALRAVRSASPEMPKERNSPEGQQARKEDHRD